MAGRDVQIERNVGRREIPTSEDERWFFFLIPLVEDVESCFGLTALIVFLNIYCVSCNRLATDSPRVEMCLVSVPRNDCNAKDLNTVVVLY